MTFSYVGYIWALFGCSFLMIFVGGVALTLHVIGKRLDRNRPRTVVESLSPSSRAADAGADAAAPEPGAPTRDPA